MWILPYIGCIRLWHTDAKVSNFEQKCKLFPRKNAWEVYFTDICNEEIANDHHNSIAWMLHNAKANSKICAA